MKGIIVASITGARLCPVMTTAMSGHRAGEPLQ